MLAFLRANGWLLCGITLSMALGVGLVLSPIASILGYGTDGLTEVAFISEWALVPVLAAAAWFIPIFD